MTAGLTETELDRLALALGAHLALPTSTDLAPDASEAIFAWAVGGSLPADAPDAKRKKRSKLLFDVTRGSRGWSLKTYTPTRLVPGSTFEVVLARAAVESKARRRRSGQAAQDAPPAIDIATASPEDVGRAVLNVRRDVLERSAETQGIVDPREGFLLRSPDNRQFVYFEHELTVEDDDEIEWRWSNDDRLGLQGRVGGKIAYRWYQSGGQLFGCFTIPEDAQEFIVEWDEVSWDDLIEFIAERRAEIAEMARGRARALRPDS
jgi:hypothetical protein